MIESYDEGTCGRCGGRNPVWFVDSDRYNTALYRGETVCPSCFVFAHQEATGMATLWELRPSTPFRWLEGEGRLTPFLSAPTEPATCPNGNPLDGHGHVGGACHDKLDDVGAEATTTPKGERRDG